MRRIRIGCILQSKFINGRPNEVMNRGEECVKEALELLDEAGGKRVDIAVLCETFPVGHAPSETDCEPIDGPTITAVRELARKHSMNVIAPILELRDGKRFNTAVVIDRKGELGGTYSKNIPFWCEVGVTPGTETRVFNLDFGCIGVAICFESQWPDRWMELGALGAEIVFWPSAYSGGRKLIAPAIYNNYYVVSCTAMPPDTTVVDICGEVLYHARGPRQVVIHELDLDRTMVHDNFNGEKLARLRQDMAGKIAMQYLPKEGWWIVESTSPEVSVKNVLKERGIETLREYTQRSRREIYELRAKGLPMPELHS